MCYNWNRLKMFANASGLPPWFSTALATSHTFVDELLLAMQIVSPQYSPMVNDFIKQITEYGKTEKCFVHSSQFCQKFGKTEPSVTFFTHAQLDDYVNHLYKTFKVDGCQSEFELLKAFDDAFHLQHAADSTNSAYTASTNGCPFFNA